MRLVIAAFFVTLLAPVGTTVACPDEDNAYQDDQARLRRQREAMRQARRAAERARRDLDRARREAERAHRQPFAQPPPGPIDPYAEPRAFKYKPPKVKEKDPKDTKDKLDKLQKKLDKLRERLERFQVPAPTVGQQPTKRPPAERTRKIEIQPIPDGVVTIDFDNGW